VLRSIISDRCFFSTLFRIDSELAEDTRARGCPCGGALHVADYPRKPRWPHDISSEHQHRLSFCCASCRRRLTPPSVRFLGRHVFAFPLVVIASALAQGRSGHPLALLLRELGVDRRTFARWRTWWREVFPATRFWNLARARFSPPLDPPSPASLLDRFASGLDGLLSLLRFLSPLSRPDPAP